MLQMTLGRRAQRLCRLAPHSLPQRNRRPEQSAPSRFLRKEHPRFRPYVAAELCAANEMQLGALINSGRPAPSRRDGANVALRSITGIIGCTATAHASSSVSSHLGVSALHLTHFFTRGTPSKVSGSASAATVQRTSSHGATFWLATDRPQRIAPVFYTCVSAPWLLRLVLLDRLKLKLSFSLHSLIEAFNAHQRNRNAENISLRSVVD